MKLNKFSLNQFVVIALAVFYSQLANAGPGQTLVRKINGINDELTLAGGAILIGGIILWAIFMMGGTSNPKFKSWGIGLVLGGLIIMMAPEIGNFLVGL